MISLDLYKIFVIVANEGNITKASEILHISQPAVTKQIHNLEDQLHTKLFSRSQKGVVLTEAGQSIYNQIKDNINSLLNFENNLFSSNKINYGTRNSIFKYIFCDIFYSFSKENPNCTLLSTIELIPMMLEKLNNYELDIVLTKKPLIDTSNLKNIKFVKLGNFHSIFVTKKNSKYTKKIYTKEQLRNETIYTKAKTATGFSELKILLDLPTYSENVIPIGTEPMKKLLIEDDAICYMTKEFIEKELADGIYDIVKTDFELETHDYGFYYNVNNRFEALNKLMQYLKDKNKSGMIKLL